MQRLERCHVVTVGNGYSNAFRNCQRDGLVQDLVHHFGRRREWLSASREVGVAPANQRQGTVRQGEHGTHSFLPYEGKESVFQLAPLRCQSAQHDRIPQRARRDCTLLGTQDGRQHAKTPTAKRGRDWNGDPRFAADQQYDAGIPLHHDIVAPVRARPSRRRRASRARHSGRISARSRGTQTTLVQMASVVGRCAGTPRRW